MPKGRIRQTPTEARWDSERRILEATAHRWVGFNEIQRVTGLAPSTVSAHLERFVAEGKVLRDIRTGRYAGTREGERWLDIRAVIQRIVGLSTRAGAVAQAHGPDPFAAATSAFAMPSIGPSAMSRAATKLPPQLLAVLLEDMVRRQDIERPSKRRAPSIKLTKAMMRTFPRIWIFEIDWDALAATLEPDTVRAVWEQVRNALPSRGLVEKAGRKHSPADPPLQRGPRT